MFKLYRKMLIASIFSLFLLVACSGGDSGTSIESKANDKIEIDFWAAPTYKDIEGIETPEYGDWEKAKINEFEEQNPNVKINLQVVAWDDIGQKTTVALAGNNPPDIILDALDVRVMQYAEAGSMEPLNEIFQEDLDDFQPSMMDIVTNNDNIYAVPVSMNPEYIFLNKKIFEEKGLEHLLPEDRDWTFDEMKDALKQVTGDGVYGTAFYAGNEQADEMQLMYLFGMGAEQWNDDSSEVIMGDFSEAADAIHFMKELIDDGIAAPGAASTTILDVLEMFKQGKIAMMPFAQSLYSQIENDMKEGNVNEGDIELYAIKPLHADDVDPKISIAGVHGYAVFKQEDENKKEMINEFVKYMTSTENVQKMASSANYVPSRISSEYEVVNEDLNAIMAEVSGLESGNLGKSNPKFTEVRSLWFPELQAAILDKKSPEDAIKDYTEKSNALLAE